MAPTLTATGNQAYCPQSQINIVSDFNIVDPDDTEIEALYVQISTGYQRGDDMLLLLGSHPNINTSWNALEGKLTLRGLSSNSVSYTDLIEAVRDIVFQSSSFQPNDKVFSITIGNANYLPLTNHYYEFVSAYGITWSDAKQQAETRTYFGLQGYLATILYPEEAQIAGEQASGSGWLGGTDEAAEGVWKWVTGPEAGTVFWNGAVNGSTPNYANWNYNEPNNVNGGEDYLHITDPSTGIPGAWNDLREVGEPPGPYYPKGYVVEYGGMPGDPVLNISASTSLYALTKVSPLPYILKVTECDDLSDGNDVNAFTNFDLTLNETTLLNGNNPSNFYFEYFLDANYLHSISNPSDFVNTLEGGQTIYVKIVNNSNDSCFTETFFDIEVAEPPIVKPSIDFINCDADALTDGFTEFNLKEISPYITSESDVSISFHLSYSKAETGSNPINESINNQTTNVVYARVENTNACYRISTVNLQVSTTSFPAGYFEELNTCDDDGVLDGYHQFDLLKMTSNFLDQFPSGQNLSVRYFENADDAQLEENEILKPSTYVNKQPFYQEIYVRVENEDNGACFDIGPLLRLNVFSPPEFEIDNAVAYCTGGAPVLVTVFNESDVYTYKWYDSSGQLISDSSYAEVVSGTQYTVVAHSSYGCQSDPFNFSVQESAIAEIDFDDITVTEASKNNSIAINTENNNLGIGAYEFAMNETDGPYQDEPVFDNLDPGTYIVYIRDKNGCGIRSIEVFILGFPKFFTPNNDGQNDVWQIKGLNPEFTNASKVSFYNRYGKLIKQIDFNGTWDGTFKGEVLPNSDYWYVAELIKASGEVKTYRGHFSLKR